MKQSPLKELPAIKKLQEIKDYVFDFQEQKADGKNIATIFFNHATPQSSFYQKVDFLQDILSAHQEFKQYNEIRIIGNEKFYRYISNETYNDLYDFLKKDPSLKIKISLGTAYSDTAKVELPNDQEHLMNKINFFIEQRQIWTQLTAHIKDYPASSLNLLFRSSQGSSRMNR